MAAPRWFRRQSLQNHQRPSRGVLVDRDNALQSKVRVTLLVDHLYNILCIRLKNDFIISHLSMQNSIASRMAAASAVAALEKCTSPEPPAHSLAMTLCTMPHRYKP
ncbi:hypothetical protein ACFX15_003739 [Malus domestica]